jgi:hypothetical protein
MKHLFIFIAFCFSFVGFTQVHIPRCNFDSLYLEELKSPDFRALQKIDEEQFQKYLGKKSDSLEILTIPVVVHIVKNMNELEMNISDEIIFRQIEILNETYNNLNADLVNTPEFFEQLIGNVGIEFCLATVDPIGFATNGITRNTTEVTQFSTATNGIKFSSMGGVDAWDTDFYLNIWVGKIAQSILGYSHLPTSTSITQQEHGLVVNYPYFGETDNPAYGMGKTAVHEIGHYLNLKHPWGTGNCDPDNDWLDDTPTTESPYAGNPVHPQTSCETVDMFMNYMDYVYDSSMVMFSKGQAERMRNALQYYRPELLLSNGCGLPLLIASPQIIHASSEMANDGSINLNVVSGIPPFSFIWDSGEELDSLADLTLGDYSVVITDSIGQEVNLNLNISFYGQIIESDNFESYSTDSLLFLQSDEWLAFCNDSFAANIADFAAPEGDQYLEINAVDGENSFSKDLGGLYNNAYDLSFNAYFPTGRAAAYTVYHNATCDNPITAFTIEFGADGLAYVFHGGDSIMFNFPQNQWVFVSHLIDLDRDIIEFYLNGSLVLDWEFSETISSAYGNNKLHSIVFNDFVDSSSQVHYFIDDFKLVLAQNSEVGINEVLENLDLFAFPNPTNDILNLRAGTKLVEPCDLMLMNTLGQVLDQKIWNPKEQSELQISVQEYPQGIYFLRIATATKTKVLKFVVGK